jgi:hypothetical protein
MIRAGPGEEPSERTRVGPLFVPVRIGGENKFATVHRLKIEFRIRLIFKFYE